MQWIGRDLIHQGTYGFGGYPILCSLSRWLRVIVPCVMATGCWGGSCLIVTLRFGFYLMAVPWRVFRKLFTISSWAFPKAVKG